MLGKRSSLSPHLNQVRQGNKDRPLLKISSHKYSPFYLQRIQFTVPTNFTFAHLFTSTDPTNAIHAVP